MAIVPGKATYFLHRILRMDKIFVWVPDMDIWHFLSNLRHRLFKKRTL